MYVCVLAARCGELELYLSLSLLARARVCACVRACVCLRPAALKRSQQLCRGLLKKMKQIGESYSTQKERALINASSSSTPSFVLCRRTLLSHVATRARGERRRETHLPPLPVSSRARVANQKSRIGRVRYERARILSLSLSLSVERCPCPRTRRPDESRGRSPSSPRLDCSLDRRF